MKHLVVFCHTNTGVNNDKGKLSELLAEEYMVLRQEGNHIGLAYEQCAKQLFRKVKQLLTNKLHEPLLVQLVGGTDGEGKLFRGLAGMLKCANKENPKFLYQIIECSEDMSLNEMVQVVKKEQETYQDTEVRYINHERYVKELETMQFGSEDVEQEIVTNPEAFLWKENGVYLITGGMGGLGNLFAKEMARRVNHVTLVLTGRRPLNETMQRELDELKSLHANAIYQNVDITDAGAVSKLIDWIRKEFHTLHGIYHCAGITRDNFMIRKSEEEFMEVLKPKVTGLVNLDQATAFLNLDFMVLFSSQAGEEGNAGQADYATGNAFMDAYAEYRNELVEIGERSGRTVSVNWPLWEEGGMQVSSEVRENMYHTRGIVPLETSHGMYALMQALEREYGQVMVIEGDLEKVSRQGDTASHHETIVRNDVTLQNEMTSQDKGSKGTLVGRKTHMNEEESIREKLTMYLKKIVGDTIQLPVNRVNPKELFDSYGIDSVMIMEMTSELEEQFGVLPKTLFFEYTSIQELADYFMESYHDKLVILYEEEKLTEELRKEAREEAKDEFCEEAFEEADKDYRLPVRSFRHTLDTPGKLTKQESCVIEFEKEPTTDLSDEIAIIGIAGKFPQADNLDEFWNNLCEGKDCITEIPLERWDYRTYYKENRQGSMDSKWGGFIHDVDKFDSLFFHISYQEAMGMDPQERLFLQCAYETIQDAGYTPDTLKSYEGEGLKANVGVFAGVMYSDYQNFAIMEQAYGNPVGLGGVTSSIANRVSYAFNLNGPSETINTMCSSSLLAIHHACQSIRSGDCEMAIAGGVNLTLHPNKYIMLSHKNFLSTEGKCRSFGANGDGYVPGEGVGSVLLKPLAQAIKDHDHIYGVVKGSAVNHGGKSNGFTVPNPNAQSDVVQRAWKKAKINPCDISYIEAHGTGTSLGDPIEIRALSKVFSRYTQDKQFCAIGSVKSNIGHLESAAGIASVIKVLLQMKYKKFVPSIHAKVLNPNIDFANCPFKVQQELEDWNTKTKVEDGQMKTVPRIAGISAFGAGGTNVHLVIEEYVEDEQILHKGAQGKADYIILLSAKTKLALNQSVDRLRNDIQNGRYAEEDLPRIAYTLQVGREAMEYRMACITTSLSDLADKLGKYQNQQTCFDMYVDNVKAGRETIALLDSDEDFIPVFQSWMEQQKYSKLLALWVKGMNFDWNVLYPDTVPEKISLPTYPFAKDRHWLPFKERNIEPIPKSSEIEEMSIMAVAVSEQQDQSLEDRILSYVKKMFSQVSKIPYDMLDEEVDLDEYGIDSVMIQDLTTYLQHDFASVSITMFYEFRCLREIADYLASNYQEEAVNLFAKKEETKAEELKKESSDSLALSSEHMQTSNGDIAIIGISGRFPEAENVQEFWNNLKESKDCIVEIPKERWNYRDFYDEEKGKKGKLYGKWGGFLKDVDKFDPLFFNIAPGNAETIDPMERIFLQSVQETLEDAGYTRKSLSQYEDLGLEGNVGVFVGATFMEYQFYGVQNQVKGNPIALTGLSSSIANSVSYYCNFHGPSMSVDTMCSSSLTALHLACNSIKNGDCQVAIAGGVNLSLHPNKYLFLSQNYFLSTKGRCAAFSNDGDGYVPGEGVVSVLLKPLEQAKKDGDHIYGVVKATAVNHGGKTNGYTVPNLNAQKQVVEKAIQESGISPRTISYLEAHGTGTALGDPIEIAALTSAYQKGTSDVGFCSIGSVKSNIGHLEAASGLASLVKVLLQMKYKQLVPSIYCKVLNENIDIAKTPFHIQHRLEPWQRPVIKEDGLYHEYPRRAGISSFGAGGSNAHVIVEEYREEDEEKPLQSGHVTAPIVLSAKTKEALQKRAKQLLNVIEEDSKLPFLDVAYTLQVGREAMEERLGFLVSSMEELKEKLTCYLEGTAQDTFVQGYCSRSKHASKEQIEQMEQSIKEGNASALLDLWMEGCEVDWSRLAIYKKKPHRVSLPTYPFEKVHCWIDDFIYENVYGCRSIECVEEAEIRCEERVEMIPWREQGGYLLLNGFCENGLQVAKEIVSYVGSVNLVIAGSHHDEMEQTIQEALRNMPDYSGSVTFMNWEIGEQDDIWKVVSEANEKCSQIHGLMIFGKNEKVSAIELETGLDQDFAIKVPECGGEISLTNMLMNQRESLLCLEDKERKQLVLEKFIEFLSRDLKIEPLRIHPEEEFATYGIDSIRAMDMVKVLKNDFSKLDGREFLSCHTIEAFANMLATEFAEDSRRWVSENDQEGKE